MEGTTTGSSFWSGWTIGKARTCSKTNRVSRLVRVVVFYPGSALLTLVLRAGSKQLTPFSIFDEGKVVLRFLITFVPFFIITGAPRASGARS